MSIEDIESSAVVLHYAALCSELLLLKREKDKPRRAAIESECREIEKCLNMTRDEIISLAKKKLPSLNL